MRTSTTELPGILIIEPSIHSDSRGFFLETFQKKRYREAGIPGDFAQDNLSFSRKGVLRGLHFQHPGAQGKLVYVLQGEIFDVAVDVRRGSPTFGRWTGVWLSGESSRQVWIPEGFAHGFCVTGETALVAYKCTSLYDPGAERAIRWNDPDVAIGWPLQKPDLSAKDAEAPLLRSFEPESLPVYQAEK
jgi:dTDP-4-dehydrorhamnose 3,5-epimerase